jgi:hypothetical protein
VHDGHACDLPQVVAQLVLAVPPAAVVGEVQVGLHDPVADPQVPGAPELDEGAMELVGLDRPVRRRGSDGRVVRHPGLLDICTEEFAPCGLKAGELGLTDERFSRPMKEPNHPCT